MDCETDGVQVLYEVPPAGQDLSPAALIQIVWALLESNQHGSWMTTPDVIEVDGLDTESALTLVEQPRALVHDRRLTVDVVWGCSLNAHGRKWNEEVASAHDQPRS